MRIVLLGAPGCGKGTQSELLQEKYGIPQVSTGDILRQGMSKNTAVGEKARAYVTSGSLVPDEVILALVEDRLSREDAAHGFILDGFPRSIPQADGLSEYLKRKSMKLNRVIKIDMAKKTLLERMTGRRICPGCGAVYNLVSQPPAREGVCDRCGTHLTQREDDTESTLRKRISVYESSTAPLIDYYDALHLLTIVNGGGSKEAVFERITAALERATGATG